MPVTAFFTAEARKQLSSTMEHMFDTPAVVEMELQIEAPRQRNPRGARMLLLPLRSDLGDISRVLGVLVAEDGASATSQRFSISSIEMRAVTVKPDAAPAPEFKAKPRSERAAGRRTSTPPMKASKRSRPGSSMNGRSWMKPRPCWNAAAAGPPKPRHPRPKARRAAARKPLTCGWSSAETEPPPAFGGRPVTRSGGRPAGCGPVRT